MNGGDRIADVLVAQGVATIFTLCGGHISPILVSAKRRGIRVVDVRDERNAVFAADATARLTGAVGVAAVTAGPGVTNTITAVKNAQLAQSPVVLLGGATATVLRGRGALQDIDQMALMRPHVKLATSVRSVRELVPTLERAFRTALSGVPGPVFVELPIDVLYDEAVVREMYGAKAAGEVRGVADLAVQAYLRLNLTRLYAGSARHSVGPRARASYAEPTPEDLEQAADVLFAARRPVFLLGSQVALRAHQLSGVVAGLERLGAPVYLSGGARGLLGRRHPLWLRHNRSAALKDSDAVFLLGVPADFRLNYGRGFRAGTRVVTVNLSAHDARLNLRPDVAVLGDPAAFVQQLSARVPADLPGRFADHLAALRARDDAREAAIAQSAQGEPAPAEPAPGDSASGEPARGGEKLIDPVAACRAIEDALDDNSVIVADGGDFVGTASYVTTPRGPLRWLDPGAFGTLGVGAGFAMGAKVARPDSEVWIIYGDGSVGFTIAEFDSFVRHGLPVIAVVGNDAGWSQIARDQVGVLGDDVGTVLARTDYDRVVEGFGARGLSARSAAELPGVLQEAKRLARAGHPVLVNVHLARSDFRQGSISI